MRTTIAASERVSREHCRKQTPPLGSVRSFSTNENSKKNLSLDLCNTPSRHGDIEQHSRTKQSHVRAQHATKIFESSNAQTQDLNPLAHLQHPNGYNLHEWVADKQVSDREVSRGSSSRNLHRAVKYPKGSYFNAADRGLHLFH